ncbi:hypothetical protein [Nocardioides jensenii]|uniref:hypothetical protein n=1 Tax=Nocardioides jensenii TaxID=1843 RepID=UPI000836AB4C|nr:hypothetical protein [Nocardioides jensenii]
MVFDQIEWGERNVDRATRRITAQEVEQAIGNADHLFPHCEHDDRALIRSMTDGGKPIVVIVQVLAHGVRPITGWEA